jgi:predicted nucleotidyltransferase
MAQGKGNQHRRENKSVASRGPGQKCYSYLRLWNQPRPRPRRRKDPPRSGFKKKPVNAKPIVKQVLKAMRSSGLEAILIGNAAAALQGAPITTDDIDFLVRKNTPYFFGKIALFAKKLDALTELPTFPFPDFYRITTRRPPPIQVDLATKIHGIGSFESLHSRATIVDVNGISLAVADLADVIKSKRATNRLKDRAVLLVLEVTLREKTKTNS